MAAKMKPMKIVNNKRSQWFFAFPVTAAVAALAEGVVGLKVEGDAPDQVCTLAIGDSQAKPDHDILPEVTIPGEVWATLMRIPRQQKAVQGLIDKGELVIWPGDPITKAA